MKFCPKCKTGFPDQMEACPTHGGDLSEIAELRPGMSIRNKGARQGVLYTALVLGVFLKKKG